MPLIQLERAGALGEYLWQCMDVWSAIEPKDTKISLYFLMYKLMAHVED